MSTKRSIRTAAAAALLTLAAGGASDAAAQEVRELRVGPLAGWGAARAWLGFSYSGGWSTPAEPASGVEVVEVKEDSPAARAGIARGDVVLAVNGLPATRDLLGSVSRAIEPGDTVRFRIRRGSAERTIAVVAAELPDWLERDRLRIFTLPDSLQHDIRVFVDSMRVAFAPDRLPRVRVLPGDSGVVYRFDRRGRGDSIVVRALPLPPDAPRPRVFSMPPLAPGEEHPGVLWLQRDFGMRSVAGAEFTRLEPEMEDYFGTDRGLLVTRVGPDTPADRAGLEPGDVVLTAGGREVRDVEDLRRALRGDDETVPIEVIRKKRRLDLRLDTD